MSKKVIITIIIILVLVVAIAGGVTAYFFLNQVKEKPEDIANIIYKKRGLNIKVTKKSSLFASISTIIDALRSKNKTSLSRSVKFSIFFNFPLLHNSFSNLLYYLCTISAFMCL